MAAPTTEFIKAWCRIDGSEFDAILTDLIADATKRAGSETGNDYFTVEMPSSVKIWCGMQVAHWVRNAEATTDRALYKTPYVDGLLDPYRLYIMETRS